MPRAQRTKIERNEIIEYVYKSSDFIALQILIFIAGGFVIRQSIINNCLIQIELIPN